MKKQMLFKIVTLTIISIMLLSVGVVSVAAFPETISPRWAYISSTAYLFDKDQELTNYDIFGIGGNTTVPSGYYAYVKVELQYLNSNGRWVNFDTWEDEGRTNALVEEYIRVTPGYSYRLLLTHKCLDANGNVLETFNNEADYYLTSLPRN